MKDAVKLIDETLAEEKKTDALLTKLAETADWSSARHGLSVHRR
jgi:ferritin-like metal-binding protein YciE